MFALQRRVKTRHVSWQSTLCGSRITRLVLTWVVLLFAGRLLGAEQQTAPAPSGQQTPTFSASVKVVNLLATVHDKKGRIVSNLAKGDFVLEEDGRPQAIRYFARESDLPLTLGLLVDTSRSQAHILDQERSASYSFLDQMLRDKDKAFLIHFDQEVELLQDVTSSRNLLRSALDLLKTAQPELRRRGGYPQGGGGGGYPPGSSRGGRYVGGTTLYDAIYLSSNEVMKAQQGRKALIVLSDGVDNASKVSLPTAIEAAQRADTLVYSIYFSDRKAYRSRGGFGPPPFGGIGGMGRHGGGRRRPPMEQAERPDGKKILQRISKETGGRLFEVSKKDSIDQIYASIAEELRNQYSIGYTSDRSDAGPGYRRIMLTTKKKGLIVQTRDGYYTAQ